MLPLDELQRSAVEGAIWPDSFRIEARKIVPLLAEVHPNQSGFPVVALSLPGYGFSAALKKGASSWLSCRLAAPFLPQLKLPSDKHDKGRPHTNLPLAGGPEFSLNPFQLFTTLFMLVSLKVGLKSAQEMQGTGCGYFGIQWTKPN
ncbi:hypothetical protein C8F04DRAFT_1189165 [Mycena alexandri]|uniref:Uncharacterized protein n=1 Tax=Mycena alexandri TaxID=1745969 RepID=A0AAD6WY77_9AGAR|nr:hypothetical protein C8F04DRAFT_1189165 [Mycena alexandri]